MHNSVVCQATMTRLRRLASLVFQCFKSNKGQSLRLFIMLFLASLSLIFLLQSVYVARLTTGATGSQSDFP